MDSSHGIWQRTRSRKTLESGVQCKGKSRMSDRVPINESEERNSEGNRGGSVRVRVCGSRPKLGFDDQKSSCNVVLTAKKEEEEGEDYIIPTGMNSEQRKRCSGLGFEEKARDSDCSFIDLVEEDEEEDEDSVDEKRNANSESFSENSCRKWRRMGSQQRLERDFRASSDSVPFDVVNSKTSNNESSENTCIGSGNQSNVGLGKSVSEPCFISSDELETSNNDKSLSNELDLSDDENGVEKETVSLSVGTDELCLLDGSISRDGNIEKLKRKRTQGLDLLISVEKDKNSSVGSDSESIPVGRRTRSQYPPVPNKNLGTIKCPFDVVESDAEDADADASDAEDSDVGESDSSYDGDDHGEGGKDEGGDEKALGGKEEGHGRDELHLGKSSTKRKRVSTLKDDSLFKLLVDTMFDKGARIPEELKELESTPQDTTPHEEERSLPLIFSFEDEARDAPKEESALEMEDDLWTECDFALKCNEIGSFCSSAVNGVHPETHSSTLCCMGEHHFVLDEEIGIVCRLCGYIQQEIRDILPSMATYPWGKSGKKVHGEGKGFSMLDELQFQDANDDSQGTLHSKGTVWDIIPVIKDAMFPHQREGFEFMWKNLAGSIVLKELKKSTRPNGVGGCVISHAPGTGKTCLAVAFLRTFMEVYPNCKPVIVAPASMLLTWENEFKIWKVDTPFHILSNIGFSGKEDSCALKLGQKNNLQSKKWVRLVKIYSWNKGGSILGLSYKMFEKLAGKSDMCDKEALKISKILLEKPGLLVLDEGHTPRNDKSSIWKSLERSETELRIILSGTLFQNNLDELYNTLHIVRPELSRKAFRLCQQKSGMRRNGLRNVSPGGKRLRYKITDECLEELRSILDPFIHVHKGSILKNLPGLKDCVLVLNPLPHQKVILDRIQEMHMSAFSHESSISLVSVHPSLWKECPLPEEQRSLFDKNILESLRQNPNEGVKTRFVMELVQLSLAMKEKVLVFSQYLQNLFFIKEHLKSLFNWTEEKEVLLLRGQTPIRHRQILINRFNNPSSEARVLLASLKACGEGISLIGASRVVLLDGAWNPSVERQAISRAYRVGQRKIVYIYHLITSGTMEGDKYLRQAAKDRLSELVFSSTDKRADEQINLLESSEDKILEEMVEHDKLKIIFKKILYQPKESTLLDGIEPVDLK
ncbi:SNF2 domain-containing protein CLASSY 3-like isoform X2 [Tasmannia lanceolata]|uniref:SNF2 domain-containing protein CLASSY 3-like isoform X2 n=1 Tax=Tasmannia lanceolata TaxID=3420 RepID=UPI0040648981